MVGGEMPDDPLVGDVGESDDAAVEPKQPATGVDQHRIRRMLILACSCFLAMPAYYIFDIPAVLSVEMQELFNVDATRYNVLFSVYSWTAVPAVLLAGLIVNRLGYRVGSVMFCSLVALGQVIFALGASRQSFVLAACGRAVFGLGGATVFMLQSVVIGRWFKGRELSFATGVTFSANHAGSLMNFFFTEPGYRRIGLMPYLWITVALCTLCLGMVCLMVWIDWTAKDTVHFNEPPRFATNPMTFLRELPLVYFCLTAFISCVYAVFIPFVANANSLFGSGRWTIEHQSIVLGVITFVSTVLSPVVGLSVDRVGQRPWWLLGSMALATVSFLGFLSPSIPPWLTMLALGVFYTVATVTLWSSIALLVPFEALGTATTLASAIETAAFGSTTVLVGALIDRFGPNALVPYCVCVSSIACAFAIYALLIDRFEDDGRLCRVESGSSTRPSIPRASEAPLLAGREEE